MDPVHPIRGISNDLRPTVLLADDNPQAVDMISAILRPAYNIIKVAVDGEEAVSWVNRLRPDLAIFDICMPKLNGIAAAQKLNQARTSTRIVFVTQIEDDDYIQKARAIAYGYVLKRRIFSDLLLALASAISGSFFVS